MNETFWPEKININPENFRHFGGPFIGIDGKIHIEGSVNPTNLLPQSFEFLGCFFEQKEFPKNPKEKNFFRVFIDPKTVLTDEQNNSMQTFMQSLREKHTPVKDKSKFETPMSLNEGAINIWIKMIKKDGYELPKKIEDGIFSEIKAIFQDGTEYLFVKHAIQ